MEIKELGHIVLYVRDLELSARFYRDVLGWRQIVPDADGSSPLRAPVAAFSAPSGRTHHELLLIEVGPSAAPLPKGRRLGLYHFGLKVGETDDELREARDAVQKSGAKIVGASDHGVTHSLYIDVQPARWKDDPSAVFAEIKPLRL